jgi:hypothetical protein
MLQGELEARPHLKAPENVQIPDEELEPCFGDAPNVTARGALIKKYGREPYDHFRDLWGCTASMAALEAEEDQAIRARRRALKRQHKPMGIPVTRRRA